ncbi:MAG: TetR/AcrR family transcriptional regulator [Enterocloster sp.]
MPTERFSKLPEHKKRKIGEVIISELQETSYDRFHITQVARKASVSRASLYTYFTGKDDMLRFSTYQIRRNIREKNSELLTRNGGNYWRMMKESLEYQMSICKNSRMYHLIYLPWEQENRQGTDLTDMEKRQIQNYKNWIYDNCTVPATDGLSREEFDTFQDVCQAFMNVTLQEWAAQKKDRSDIVDDFDQKLHHLESVPR